ncbi:MAG TPA: hypothetical protein VKT72_04425 [Candidatus Baltobacteraceae bacterium]|nr:hypothetical protein [Candidatus Baltobacteraceae bacterium]
MCRVLGIYHNGKELAIPTALGMQGPVEPTKPTPNAPNGHPNDNYEVEASSCEYNVHTHDYSGLIHIEDTSVAQSTAPTSPLSYAPTLQSLRISGAFS